MNKANQLQLIHSTNINLIHIRTLEIDYFSYFFSTLGTQCALLVGFICGFTSQVPNIDVDVSFFWVLLYWIAPVISLGAAVHVLACSVVATAYGPGLAIRGAEGSMVTAIDGMIIEQQQMVFTFVLAIITFELGMIGMYWMMMDTVSSMCVTILSFFGMGFWYYSCLRIYNKFYFHSSQNMKWDEERDSVKELKELTPNVDDDGLAMLNHDLKKKLISDKKVAKNQQGQNNQLNSSYEPPLTARSHIDITNSVVHSGFLAVKISNRSFVDPWSRRYFVIKDEQLFYYKDKRSYELNSSKPLNTRPVELDGYSLSSNVDGSLFYITLSPIDTDDIRKDWKFRCDTLKEYTDWIYIFNSILNK